MRDYTIENIKNNPEQYIGLYAGHEVKIDGIKNKAFLRGISGNNLLVNFVDSSVMTVKSTGETKLLLRPLSDLKFSEVNEICSIIIEKDIACGYIEWNPEKDFILAYFKKEELDGGKDGFILMGITIDWAFNVDYTWQRVIGNSNGSSSQRLNNHNLVTAYLIRNGFDIFGLISEGIAADKTKSNEKK